MTIGKKSEPELQSIARSMPAPGFILYGGDLFAKLEATKEHILLRGYNKRVFTLLIRKDGSFNFTFEVPLEKISGTEKGIVPYFKNAVNANDTETLISNLCGLAEKLSVTIKNISNVLFQRQVIGDFPESARKKGLKEFNSYSKFLAELAAAIAAKNCAIVRQTEKEFTEEVAGRLVRIAEKAYLSSLRL